MFGLAETTLSNHREADGLILVGLFLLAGFVAHVLGNRVHVPRVSLLLLLGFIAGPASYNLIPSEAAKWFPLATELALSMIGFQLGERFLGKTLKETGIGNEVLSVVIGTTVVFEIIGPIAARLSLIHAGEIVAGEIVAGEIVAGDNENDSDDNDGDDSDRPTASQ